LTTLQHSGPQAEVESAERRLVRGMADTIAAWRLIEPGDRILVAMSGGKDSYTLLDLLERARRRAPVRFELLAFHLDQGQPGYDGGPLRGWLLASGVPFRIEREDTYAVVAARALQDAKETYCRVCSRLRRGVLYSAAERLGCNKLALGHHRDDALETLLLNLLYAGKLQAMPAAYTTNDGRFQVVRPLIECAQTDITSFAAGQGYPILPCNLCGSQTDLKRVRVARLLETLEREIPNVRQVMLAALKNVRASHLLDPEVAEAWQRASGEYEPRR
jgi:tRNA 2-thiocytidine biosynthesis protein TtcA